EIDTVDLRTPHTRRWAVPVVLMLGTAMSAMFFYDGGLATLRSRVGFPVRAVGRVEAAARPAPVAPVQPSNPIALDNAPAEVQAPPAPEPRQIAEPEAPVPVQRAEPAVALLPLHVVHAAPAVTRSSHGRRGRPASPLTVGRTVTTGRAPSADEDATMPLDENLGGGH
ncbi:MAG TPA: hypothetical protein VGP07_14140, partial [Polyangia bacterium]